MKFKKLIPIIKGIITTCIFLFITYTVIIETTGLTGISIKDILLHTLHLFICAALVFIVLVFACFIIISIFDGFKYVFKLFKKRKVIRNEYN